jgi:hypothetical protein
MLYGRKFDLSPSNFCPHSGHDLGGVFLRRKVSMLENSRTKAFLDGQNFYHCAKATFGYLYHNYDPVKLSQLVCHNKNWQLEAVRFYTGISSQADNLSWNSF